MKRRDRDLLITDALLTIKDYARACHMELERIRVAVEAREERVTYVVNETGLPERVADDTCLLCGEDCTDETCAGPRERDCT